MASFLFKKSNKANNLQIKENLLSEIREQYKDGDVIVKVESYKSKRSLEQNAYAWKLFDLLGQHIGYDKEDIKDFFMIELGHFTEHQFGLKTKIKVKSTTSLKVDEFSVLIQCVIDKLIENNINYPTPQHYGCEL